MRILVCSLQVSRGGSLGHFHPALELALMFKDEHHKVALLPLPSPLDDDAAQVVRGLGIQYLAPPPLTSVFFNTQTLGEMARDPKRVAAVYQSFLLDPIPYQKDKVMQMIQDFSPTIIIFDLMVYLAKIAATFLKIPEIGFCAGLKLVAPHRFQTLYANMARELLPIRNQFFRSVQGEIKFHHLEVLAKHANLVFAPVELVGKESIWDDSIFCIGPLAPSHHRNEKTANSFGNDAKKYALLSFGSVLDPADYPVVLQSVIDCTHELDLELFVVSKKLSTSKSWPHVHYFPYLPLLSMIKDAEFFIHHGGANSFSEALLHGAKQIIIPLTTDQPMQAHYLTKAQAGYSLAPKDVTKIELFKIIRRLMDAGDTVHENRQILSRLYQSANARGEVINLAKKLSFESYEEPHRD